MKRGHTLPPECVINKQVDKVHGCFEALVSFGYATQGNANNASVDMHFLTATGIIGRLGRSEHNSLTLAIYTLKKTHCCVFYMRQSVCSYELAWHDRCRCAPSHSIPLRMEYARSCVMPCHCWFDAWAYSCRHVRLVFRY